ncbi:MAG: T9SS type A sorting domain-containing protein [Candidatus Stygibacter australis]|nr:T9SS type A sorting domain-containing protein [Candidatus Stygibacter australis]
MCKVKKYIIAFIMLIPLLLSATLYVDDDYTSPTPPEFNEIQDAVDYAETNSLNGEIINVYAGAYDPIIIGAVGLTIKRYGSGSVYIDGSGTNSSCIDFDASQATTTYFEDIIIRNGCPSLYGGGIKLSANRDISLENCEIINCSATYGGGIYIGGQPIRSNCTMSNCIISNNTASQNGGGIYGTFASFDMENCVINGNSANCGGGLYTYGVFINSNDTDRVLMYGNSATANGGAIYMAGVSGGYYNDSIHLGSVTIADNTSTYGVGGIYVENTDDVTLELVNCIIWDNDGTPQVPTGTDIEITYSDVEGLNTGTGNINTDPEFISYTEYPLEYYSPCINKGNDDSDYDDPDGSVADMGWNPYEHDVYKWADSASARVYIWKCFPKLPLDPDHFTENAGDDIDVDEAWENWRPEPTSYFYAWYGSSTCDVYGWITTGWNWTPPTYEVNSTKGYKLQRTGTGDPVMFSSGLLCEEDVTLYTSPGEDWLGYYLPSAQRVLDAFPSAVTDDAIKIWTQNWCISRNTVNDPWTGTPTSCYLNYMDAVMITTVSSTHRFPWETPTREDELGVRPVAEHFTFVDEIDYQPIYAYFEEDNLPQEVAVYVNDVCKGAQVVEDTICQICAYILEEDEGEEIEFAFWYDDRSEIERCNSYLVFDEDSGEYEQQSLLTGTPGIHYEVSFERGYEEVIPVDHNLRCYPNPFNPELTISFNLEETRLVNLDVYNIRGQKVKSLAAETFRPDDYNIVWKGDDNAGNKVSSGVYYIRLQVGEEIVNRKVILMK